MMMCLDFGYDWRINFVLYRIWRELERLDAMAISEDFLEFRVEAVVP